MGSQTSKIDLCTNFDADEIRRLGKRFRQLDLDTHATLNTHELVPEEELGEHPFSQRVINLFDPEGTGEVDFKDFIQGLSQFSVKGDTISKLRFAFRLYDVGNNGHLTNGDICQLLKMLVGDNMTDTQIQQIVDHTLVFADKDEEGKISFEDFCNLVLKPGK